MPDPTTQAVSHLLPDLTAFLTALGIVIGGLTGLLALILPAIAKLKREMIQVKIDTAVANTKSDASAQQVQALNTAVIKVAQDQTPPVPVKAADYLKQDGA